MGGEAVSEDYSTHDCMVRYRSGGEGGEGNGMFGSVGFGGVEIDGDLAGMPDGPRAKRLVAVARKT